MAIVKQLYNNEADWSDSPIMKKLKAKDQQRAEQAIAKYELSIKQSKNKNASRTKKAS